MTVVEGDGLRLRRASRAEVDYLVTLAASPEVEPFLAAVSPWTEEETRAAIEEQEREPGDTGRFVLETATGGDWARAGGVAFSLQNRRSRIAYLFGVMVEPGARGRGLAGQAARLLAEHLIRDLDYHRVQLEVYGYNERAAAVFARAGFIREGAKRKAYWRNGAWHDGVLFALLAEDLEAS